FVNDEEVSPRHAIHLVPGDELSFGFITKGVRAYLAIRGGIDVPTLMESRSTHVLLGIGGHQGRPLQTGDELYVKNNTPEKNIPSPSDSFFDELVQDSMPEFGGKTDIRFVPGMFSYRLTPAGLQDFQDRIWKVTP